MNWVNRIFSWDLEIGKQIKMISSRSIGWKDTSRIVKKYLADVVQWSWNIFRTCEMFSNILNVLPAFEDWNVLYWNLFGFSCKMWKSENGKNWLKLHRTPGHMLSPSPWPPPLHMLTPGQLHSFTWSVGPYSHLTTNLLKEQVAIRAYIQARFTGEQNL